MVYLSRIYTKSGDCGETSLGDGTRVGKDHPRVQAYGSVDELNSVLGLLVTDLPDDTDRQLILRIQNDLFDLGADLCVPQSEKELTSNHLRILNQQVSQLEQEIDRRNLALAPLTSFILPGGSRGAAWCHLARTVCRRAERDVYHLGKLEKINSNALIYLNRLSYLLFVLARFRNQQSGCGDQLWKPGENRRKDQ